MSRPKSPERILRDKERAIRRERRELRQAEKAARRAARDIKRKAQESFDAKNGGDYTMKRSEYRPALRCKLCGEGSMDVVIAGFGFVCYRCEAEARLIVVSPQPDGQGEKDNEGNQSLFQLS